MMKTGSKSNNFQKTNRNHFKIFLKLMFGHCREFICDRYAK